MHVLSVVHGHEARTELFAPVVAEAGHKLDEWSFAWNTAPPRAVGLSTISARAMVLSSPVKPR